MIKIKMAASGEFDLVNDYIVEDKLVDIWPNYPCLFDVRSPDFKNRDKRQKAHEEIAKELHRTVEWVKSKLRLLRNSYTKAKRAPPSGSSRKNQTKRTVWILEKLQFLAPHIAERSSVSNIDTPSPTPTTDSDTPIDPLLDNSEVEDSNTLVEKDENEKGDLANSTKRPTATRPKSIKQKHDEEEYQLMKGLASSISTRYKKQNQAKQDSQLMHLVFMSPKHCQNSIRQ